MRRFFCREDPDFYRDDHTPPRRVSRHWRDYIPSINFLKAFPPFQLLSCFSLANASERASNSSTKINLKGIRFFVDRCFPEL